MQILLPEAFNCTVSSERPALSLFCFCFQSFFELFVRFLEKESSPMPSAKLPVERMAQEQQEKLHRSSSLSSNGPSTPLPVVLPLSNQYSTAIHSQSIPVFDMYQPASLPVPEEKQTVTSPHTETQRTEIPIDLSVFGLDN